MSTTAYQSPGGPRPPSPTPVRRGVNTGQALAATADLIARRRRYLSDPAVRRLLGPADVTEVVAEIDAVLSRRGHAA